LQFYNVSFHGLPTGGLYADFRRHAVSFLMENSMENHAQIGIIIASEFGMDLCGYLIVRWLVDEQNCSLKEATNLFARAFPPGI
jgi:hypothetical protein